MGNRSHTTQQGISENYTKVLRSSLLVTSALRPTAFSNTLALKSARFKKRTVSRVTHVTASLGSQSHSNP